MAQNKVYEQLDAVVAPSKVKSIEFNTTVTGRYRVRHCMGKVGNAIRYSDASTMFTFMHTGEDGKVVPGFQVEQLALAMKDFLSKQETPNEAQIKALDDFISASIA